MFRRKIPNLFGQAASLPEGLGIWAVCVYARRGVKREVSLLVHYCFTRRTYSCITSAGYN